MNRNAEVTPEQMHEAVGQVGLALARIDVTVRSVAKLQRGHERRLRRLEYVMWSTGGTAVASAALTVLNYVKG
jgi:hypothetical protein